MTSTPRHCDGCAKLFVLSDKPLYTVQSSRNNDLIF